MKFKFLGRNDSFCIELVAHNIVPKGKYLQKGDIINVPDDNKDVIASLDASGVFQRVQDNKVNKKRKK